jgi:hypothetical protein
MMNSALKYTAVALLPSLTSHKTPSVVPQLQQKNKIQNIIDMSNNIRVLLNIWIPADEKAYTSTRILRYNLFMICKLLLSHHIFINTSGTLVFKTPHQNFIKTIVENFLVLTYK